MPAFSFTETNGLHYCEKSCQQQMDNLGRVNVNFVLTILVCKHNCLLNVFEICKECCTLLYGAAQLRVRYIGLGYVAPAAGHCCTVGSLQIAQRGDMFVLE